MKKFLKILLIVIGIVFLIFAALICIGLFVDYDDHIENGRYTYVPEEENKGNEYIEFKLTDNGKDDSKLTYYNSIVFDPKTLNDLFPYRNYHCLPFNEIS